MTEPTGTGWFLSPRSPAAMEVEHRLALAEITLDRAMELWAALGVEVSDRPFPEPLRAVLPDVEAALADMAEQNRVLRQADAQQAAADQLAERARRNRRHTME